jgi:hypothetical protein
MPRHNLESAEIEGILRILRRNGQSPTVIRKVAQQYSVTESTISAIGKVITEGAGKILHEGASSVLTETSTTGMSAQESRKQLLAEELVQRVTVAESRESLADASWQDLEALAAAYG